MNRHVSLQLARGTLLVSTFTLLFLAASSLAAAGPLSEQAASTLHGEAGMHAEMDASHAGTRSIGPTGLFLLRPVAVGEQPIEQAAFLAHTGWAEVTLDLEQGSTRAGTSSDADQTNDSAGVDATLRWVAKHSPFSLTIPYTGSRMGVHTNEDDSAAVLRYHGLALQPGWFVRPDTEISVAIGYLEADLFYDSGSGYTYMAWDIWSYVAQAKSVLDLGGGRWLSLEPAVSYIKDQQDNKLQGFAVDGRFYPQRWFSIGAHFSRSGYSEGKNKEWGTYLEAMGVTELGLRGTADFNSLFGLEAYFNYQMPAKDDADSRLMMGMKAVVRWSSDS